MSTKVKGEAIKEGSIPLSALNDLQKAFIPHCDNVWEMTLTNEYQVFPTNEIWYEDSVIYGTPVIYVYDEIIFIECENIEENKEYVYKHSNTQIAFYIKVDNGSVKIKGDSFVIDDLLGQVYVGIYPKGLKPNLKIPTPDWNAQEGDVGYIMNKPFYFEGQKLFEFDNDMSSGSVLVYSSELDSLIKFETNSGTIIGTINNIINKSYIAPSGAAFTLIYEEDTEHFIINDEYGEIGSGMYNVVNKCNFYIDKRPYGSKFLNAVLIDDTVLKTTPQTLSDTDKNQALANLGIKSEYQRYKEYANKIGLELGDLLFTNETSYYKYKTAKEQFGCTFKSSPLSYEHYNETVSFDTYGIKWGHIVALFEGIANWGYVSEAYDGHMWANIYSDDGDFVLNIDIINETVLNEGR